MASWFKIDAKASAVPTVYIYDEIGLFGVNANDFAKELRALGDLKGKPLNLRLNTPGGDVFGGWAVMALLRDTGANITVYIDGVAASMGSVIAMMGDKVIMAEGAQMMIHNPAGVFRGDSEDMKAASTLLDSIKEGMITAYAKKSGLGREAIAKIMDAETWFTAQEAVDAGFADEIGEVVKAAAAFDLSRYSRNPPPVAAQHKESDMDKTEVAAMIADANKPLVDAIAALTQKKDAPATKTEAEIRDELKAEGIARANDITELCALAGLPDLAAAYIAGDKDLAAVKADLKVKQAEKTARGSDRRINNHVSGSSNTAEDGKDEEDISDLIPKARSHADIWAQFNGKGVRH